MTCPLLDLDYTESWINFKLETDTMDTI